jgi:hypothetical protein
MFGATAKTAPPPPPTTSATGKMKPPTYSPAEAQSLRESPQGAWASRPPSTQGRDGSPQPSQTSGATRRHEGWLRLKNGASRRSAPILVFPPLPIRDHPFPFAGQRFLLRELVSFEHALDHRMAKKHPRITQIPANENRASHEATKPRRKSISAICPYLLPPPLSAPLREISAFHPLLTPSHESPSR